MSELETRLTRDPADLEALAAIVAWAFGDETRLALEWLQRAEPGNIRVAHRSGTLDSKLEAGLLEVPMGQWFGGERVPLLGLAGVAVAPEARGQGLAFELVRATLRAARERKIPLSMLYPSTYRLYRKAGYELAGSWCRFTLQLGKIPRMREQLAIESLDDEAAEALYRQVARQRNGYLDRGAYVWGRVRAPRGASARGFGVRTAEGLIGYVYARHAELRKTPMELSLSDFVASDPRAFRAFLGFFAEHSSLGDRVSWHGGPADARLFAVPERGLTTSIEEYWMLRLVHVEQALLSRGYSEQLSVDIDLEVEDDVLPDNSGVYALRVRAGKPELARAATGAPRVRLGVRPLAALYTGFVSPRELAWAGELQADERALGALGALFAGPAPGTADFF